MKKPFLTKKDLPFILLFLFAASIPAIAEFYSVSPNMGLPIPSVGTEPGPQYANDINSSLTLIDLHNHTPGYGVQVPPSGININSDLTFGSNNATNMRAVRFTSQSSTLSASADNGAIYESGVDLYFRDGNGNNVRITQTGGVAGSVGSISGLVAPATASYSAGSSTFTWQSAANTAANMDFASAVLRNSTANSKGLTLAPPNAMGSNFTVTLPSLPGATSFMQIDTSGSISASSAVSAGLTGSNIASNVNLNGKAVQENSNNLVVSNTNATNSLAVLRGRINVVYNAGGVATSVTIVNGEGFSVSTLGTAFVRITFTTSFGDVPAVTGTVETTGTNFSTAFVQTLNTILVSRVDLGVFNGVPGGGNCNIAFSAIGQRL